MADSERRPRACAALDEQRSALVDGALGDADRERLLTHLVGCPGCRDDVAELRRIRRLLTDDTLTSGSPSYGLADRLVAIAGTDAQEPLLASPFRHGAGGPGTDRTRPHRPALRRGRRRAARATVAAGGLTAAVLLVGGVGLSAAPAALTAVADPTAGAQAEFSALTAQLPLADSAGSVVMAGGQVLGASLQAVSAPVIGPTSELGELRELDGKAALAVLRRAAGSAGQVSYHGTQVFHVLSDGQVLGAQVTVQTRMGDGREVAVYDASGHRLLSSVSAGTPSRVVDSDELTLLAENYLLGGSRGAEVAGRSATVIAAVRPSGQAAARWWIDDVTGLLLWHESYDTAGRTTMTAGFTSVRIGEKDSVGRAPTAAAVPMTSTSLTLANTGRLVAAGWVCPDELEGLSLVRLRTDDADTPEVVHLSYTDGLTAVSVFEQRGGLGSAPPGTRWDDRLGAYAKGGAAKVATWQSGSTVYTVVTDGSHDQLAAAVAALPHEATPARTTIERVRAGWSRILHSVTG